VLQTKEKEVNIENNKKNAAKETTKNDIKNALGIKKKESKPKNRRN